MPFFIRDIRLLQMVRKDSKEFRHTSVKINTSRSFAMFNMAIFVGTFHDGQARLLFSSAQVDYLRYWMHAMKVSVRF
jgi:hypothetical protein